VSCNGKGNGNRGLGAPTLSGPCPRGEAQRKQVTTRYAAAVVAREGGTGALGGRESGGCAIGADPWQSAHSSVGLRSGQGQVRGWGGWMSPILVWTLRRGA
jgi:hypothetical protein